MIRNETEYKAAVEKLTEHEKRLTTLKASLKQEGLTPSQVKRGMEPMVSFTEQLREEIAYYEHLKQGSIPDIQGFSTIGHILIALRIAQDVSQSELANRLGVDRSLISRDEKNEYHGITIERAERVLQALKGSVQIRVQTTAAPGLPPEPKRSRVKVPV